MNEFREHLFDRRDQALDAAMNARGHLGDLLTECEDGEFADAMAEVARRLPYARWWMKVTDNIEHGGMDPMAALTAARQTLLLRSSPDTTCMFRHSQALADIDATRRFFNDTALLNLDTITGPGPATPTVTTTAAPPNRPNAGPAAGPTPPPITGWRPQ